MVSLQGMASAGAISVQALCGEGKESSRWAGASRGKGRKRQQAWQLGFPLGLPRLGLLLAAVGCVFGPNWAKIWALGPIKNKEKNKIKYDNK